MHAQTCAWTYKVGCMLARMRGHTNLGALAHVRVDAQTCMHVWMCAWLCEWMHACTCAWLCEWMHASTCAWLCEWMHASTCAWLCEWMHACTCAWLQDVGARPAAKARLGPGLGGKARANPLMDPLGALGLGVGTGAKAGQMAKRLPAAAAAAPKPLAAADAAAADASPAPSSAAAPPVAQKPEEPQLSARERAIMVIPRMRVHVRIYIQHEFGCTVLLALLDARSHTRLVGIQRCTYVCSITP
eukprot:365922-Chlamydomonas_euryale.AAC.2